MCIRDRTYTGDEDAVEIFDTSSLDGGLQVAVAQLHLQRDNRRGATILFGEALGRLKRPGTPELGLDIEGLCTCVEQRLRSLQLNEDPELCTVPFLRIVD